MRAAAVAAGVANWSLIGPLFIKSESGDSRVFSAFFASFEASAGCRASPLRTRFSSIGNTIVIKYYFIKCS